MTMPNPTPLTGVSLSPMMATAARTAWGAGGGKGAGRTTCGEGVQRRFNLKLQRGRPRTAGMY